MIPMLNKNSTSDIVIPKRDFVLWVVDSAPKNELMSFTRIQKMIYLLQQTLKEKFKIDLGYKFADHMSHTGPYDRDLQHDIEVWLVTACMSAQRRPYNIQSKIFVPTHNIRTTENGHLYVMEYAIKNLQNKLGKNNFEMMENLLHSYNNTSENGLIEKSMLIHAAA